MMSQTIQATARTPPSKTVLAVLTFVPFLQTMGLDRIYMGAHKSGLLKCFFFVMVVILPEALNPAFSIMASILFFWELFDFMYVLQNLLSFSKNRVYANTELGWESEEGVRVAFWVGAIAGVPTMALYVVMLAAILDMGLEQSVDTAGEKMGVKELMPSGRRVKEMLNGK